MNQEVVVIPTDTGFTGRDGTTSGRVGSGPRRRVSERAVIDRLQKLRVVLPAMAQETAIARREAVRLRTENARLARRLEELEADDRT
jgi:hypothetical protein